MGGPALALAGAEFFASGQESGAIHASTTSCVCCAPWCCAVLLPVGPQAAIAGVKVAGLKGLKFLNKVSAHPDPPGTPQQGAPSAGALLWHGRPAPARRMHSASRASATTVCRPSCLPA